jgi:hypothetical protein
MTEPNHHAPHHALPHATPHPGRPALSVFDIELRLLLEAIYLRYQHDFRH